MSIETCFNTVSNFCKQNKELLNAGAIGVGVFANLFLGINAIGSISERNAAKNNSIFNKK